MLPSFTCPPVYYYYYYYYYDYYSLLFVYYYYYYYYYFFFFFLLLLLPLKFVWGSRPGRGVRPARPRRDPTGREEPVRFDSFRFPTFRQFIGSVRIGSEKHLSLFDVVRPARLGGIPLGGFTGGGFVKACTHVLVPSATARHLVPAASIRWKRTVCVALGDAQQTNPIK